MPTESGSKTNMSSIPTKLTKQTNGNKEEEIICEILSNRGIIYKPKFKIWRGTSKLTLTDLGLDSSAFNTYESDNGKVLDEELITLGRKQIVTKSHLSKITAIEAKTNAYFKTNGRQMFGAGYFIINEALNQTEKFIEKIGEEWNDAVSEFINEWSVIRKNSEDSWNKFFHDHLDEGKRKSAFGHLVLSYPNIFQLKRSFQFKMFRMNFKVPDYLEMTVKDLEDHKLVMSEHEAAREAARESATKEAANFIKESIYNLRSELGEVCDEMLKTMTNSNLGVHQKTLNRFNDIKKHFKAMNFVGDDKVDELIEGLHSEATKHSAKELRDDPEALGKLTKTIQLVGKQAKDLMEQDSQDILDKFIKQGKRKIVNPFGE